MTSSENSERRSANHRFLLQRLEDCNLKHKQCNEDFYGYPRGPDDVPQLPTRVLSVGTETDGDIRLVDQSLNPAGHLRHGHYIALSHCWGPEGKHVIKTTTANINSHLQGIPFEKLSNTFRDAVTITRKLGIQYLWIDSLCIIQDDKKDWEREAPTMGSVYEGAYLTICATGAADGSEGCFEVAEQEPAEPVTHDDNYGDLYRHERSKDDILGPLQHRAWITQEWILSRRQIHYCRGRLAWCCDELQQYNDGSRVKVVLRVNSDMNQGVFEELTDIRDWYPRADKVMAVWKWIVQEYTERNLTFATDKLAAIEGLIRKLVHGDETRCPYGVMMDDLPYSLAWSRWPEHYLQRPVELRAKGFPSWSWTSTNGKVDYARSFPDGLVEELCECECDSQSKRMILHSRYAYTETSLSSIGKGQRNSVLIDCEADAVGGSFNGDHCVYVVVPLIRSPPEYDCDCLILRQINDRLDTFERIGMAWNLEIDDLYDLQPEGVSTEWPGHKIIVI